MRDTLIQHNGFSGQAIHAEDGERVAKLSGAMNMNAHGYGGLRVLHDMGGENLWPWQ